MPKFPNRDFEFYEDDDPHGFFAPKLERNIKDMIYDIIPVNSYLSRFIDTKPFQRLRNIKQLGTSNFVWPSASHSRFEHSLGVAYLARCVASHLQRSQPTLRILDRDVACVEIAGLCHDLGHGPWSHVWDGIFMPLAMKGTKWQHEDGSEMMFDFLVDTYHIPISPDDGRFIKALIAGDSAKCRSSEKPFLFDIVANKRNGLDVDKFDYIQRDSRMIGEPISINLTHLLKSAKVLDNQICYDIKDANQLYEICQTRFKLHKLIYNHKSAKAIEYMIVDALLSAEPHLKIAERVLDPNRFLHLTDLIMNSIEESESPELEKARAIFSRIRERDLYKCVDYKVVDYSMLSTFTEFVTPQRIFEATRSTSLTAQPRPRTLSAGTEASADIEQIDQDDYQPNDADDADGVLEPDDIIVDFSTMHYGMKEKNPLDFVRFYSKRNPNESSFAGPGVYSGLRPAVFAESLLRIYTKKSKYFGLVQAGYRAVLDQMPQLVDMEKLRRDSWTFDIPDPFTTFEEESPVLEQSGSTAIPFPSSVVAPSTPGPRSLTLSRSPSHPDLALDPGVVRKRTFSKAMSADLLFSNNSFTTVSPNFAPASPLASARRNVSGSRASFLANNRNHDIGGAHQRGGKENDSGTDGGAATPSPASDIQVKDRAPVDAPSNISPLVPPPLLNREKEEGLGKDRPPNSSAPEISNLAAPIKLKREREGDVEDQAGLGLRGKRRKELDERGR